MIKIDHIELTGIDNYHSALDALNKAMTCHLDYYLKKDILDASDKCYNTIQSLYQKSDDYLTQWEKLLGKYYKANMSRKMDYGNYTQTWYIFPYEVIEENSTIWMLIVDPSENYIGGAHDTHKDAETLWFYDIELEEITPEEFYKQAVKSVGHVIDRRLKRLEDGKNYKQNQSTVSDQN